MTDPKNGLSAQEVAALAAGVVVVIAAAFLTTQLRPIPFPWNFALSLGLGAATSLGMLKVLDPRTPRDLIEDQAAAEYRSMLSEIAGIAARTWAAGQHGYLKPPTMQRLMAISSVVGSLVRRYQTGTPDFAGASATLTVLKQFERVLAYYLRIKSGEQFMDADAKLREIAETEEQTIPMVQAALQTLGKQLDAGAVVDKKVWEGTLASLLRSLNLIDSLKDHADVWLADKEEPQ